MRLQFFFFSIVTIDNEQRAQRPRQHRLCVLWSTPPITLSQLVAPSSPPTISQRPAQCERRPDSPESPPTSARQASSSQLDAIATPCAISIASPAIAARAAATSTPSQPTPLPLPLSLRTKYPRRHHHNPLRRLHRLTRQRCRRSCRLGPPCTGSTAFPAGAVRAEVTSTLATTSSASAKGGAAASADNSTPGHLTAPSVPHPHPTRSSAAPCFASLRHYLFYLYAQSHSLLLQLYTHISMLSLYLYLSVSKINITAVSNAHCLLLSSMILVYVS